MKPYIFLAAVLALTACSSSSSDRPSSNDERQAAIQRERNEREQAQAQADARNDVREGNALYEGDEPLLDVERDQAAVGSDTTDRQAGRTGTTGRDARDADDRGRRDNTGREADNTGREADNTGREADNTGRNERDDESSKLTASDQSNRASDIDITQAIRKKVIADDGLSFNAKNVKIITVSGKVTLRGPVESSAESSSIEKAARAVPGVVDVDNEIQVKR